MTRQDRSTHTMRRPRSDTHSPRVPGQLEIQFCDPSRPSEDRSPCKQAPPKAHQVRSRRGKLKEGRSVRAIWPSGALRHRRHDCRDDTTPDLSTAKAGRVARAAPRHRGHRHRTMGRNQRVRSRRGHLRSHCTVSHLRSHAGKALSFGFRHAGRVQTPWPHRTQNWVGSHHSAVYISV